MNKKDYTVLQLDMIKELANVGGGNAATSISQLVRKPVNMSVPTIDILNYNEIYENILPEDEMVIAVSMRMIGDAEGNFLFVCKDSDSRSLIHMMLPEGIQNTEEIAHSAIKELVNILVTSYLNAISKMVSVNLISSVPALATDMFGAILSSAYIESEHYDENIMIIKNEFLHQGDKIESDLYFIPRPGVLDSLFKMIGI
ncbi:MAG: chemotaxis protein CheC [Eubacteriales bacterium]